MVAQLFPIADVVTIGSPVATDFDIEGFLDFFFMLLKGSFGIGLPFGQQIVTLPLKGDLIEGDAILTGTIDGIKQPNVTSYFVNYHLG
ncbi:MAG: hypothetical protein K6F96_07890 [Bacteroidales bacterium]|nr:hypothetical protein [Bacteroidales bacterium]